MNIRNSDRRAYKEGRLNDIPEQRREQVKEALKALERQIMSEINRDVLTQLEDPVESEGE